MKKIGLGVIGCGVISQHHLKAAKDSPLIDVVAVADLRLQAAQATAKKFEVKAVYVNASALLADSRVEAVVLALPTSGRAEIALKAFALGKHVLIEKPAAMNTGEIERMIAARGGLIAACCSSRYRFLDSAGAATDFFATGALGDLRRVRCQAVVPVDKPPVTPPPAWRLNKSLNGGGILVNWGCYDLDYVLGITGWSLRPELVLAHTWPISPKLASYAAPGSDAETYFTALISCKGGTVITLERGEYVPGRPEGVWQLSGTEGTLYLNMNAGPPVKIEFDFVTETGVASKVVWQSEKPEGFEAARSGPVQDFAAAIRENRPPKTTLEQALVIQKITDSIYASAEKGVAVTIDF